MSTKGKLTREEAIAIVGASAVAAVEGENCEPTNRVGYNGACQGDELTEWSASVSAVDREGIEVSLVAYYYTTHDQDASLGDGSTIDWEIAGYEVE